MSAEVFKGASFAGDYARFSMPYSDEVYATIMDYCKEETTFHFDVAADVACGAGTGTVPLAKYFRSVVGVDFSEGQIEAAKKQYKSYENVTFKVGSAEDLNILANSSVDLVTIAAGYHWVDRGRFDSEVKRVLRAGGVMAAYGRFFGDLEVQGNEIADLSQVWNTFLFDTLKNSWPDIASFSRRKYADFALPLDDFRRVDDLIVRHTVSPSYLANHMGSTAVCKKYKQLHPDSTVIEKLGNDLNVASGGRDISIKWPNFLLLGRKGHK